MNDEIINHVVVVGDILLDRDITGRAERFAPDAPVPVIESPRERLRPGGAGLAALLAARDGSRVTLIAAVAGDRPGARLATLLSSHGVELVSLHSNQPTAQRVRLYANDQPVARIDLGGRRSRISAELSDEGHWALRNASSILVSDYGLGVTAIPSLRYELERLAKEKPVVWDPHPKGSPPVSGITVATPNRNEAEQFVLESGGRLSAHVYDDEESAASYARKLISHWRVEGVAVTLSDKGAVLVDDDRNSHYLDTPYHTDGDPCGAGDRFASAVAGLLSDGLDLESAIAGAVEIATDFVADGGALGISDQLGSEGEIELERFMAS